MSEHIFHLVPAAEWRRGLDPYAPPTLDDEGFVHCSTVGQVARVADTLFAGRRDLILLEIDPTRLSAEVVWEDLYDLGEDFPHVYGPIARGAVVAATAYLPHADGRFTTPDRHPPR